MTLTTEEGRHLANLAGRGYTKALSRLLNEMVDKGAVDSVLEIDSFAELATKFVGSSPSSTQQIAATNDIVVWREKGFRYQCVTSGEHFDYTGSGGLKWKALPAENGRYNVLAFAATIRGGLVAAFAAGVTSVKIPICDENWSDGVEIPANADIEGVGDLSIIRITGTNKTALWASSKSNIRIAKLYIDGNLTGDGATTAGSTGGHGVSIVGCSNVVIEDNTFDNIGRETSGGYASCVWANNCENITVERNLFLENNGGGVANTGADINLSYYTRSCRIINNYSKSEQDSFVSVSAVGASDEETTRHIITGNYAERSDSSVARTGILCPYDAKPTMATVANNVLVNFPANGIYLSAGAANTGETAGVSIVGNIVRFCGGANAMVNISSGIYLSGRAGTSCVGNLVERSGYKKAGTARDNAVAGIFVVGSTRNVSIASNNVVRSRGAGIFLRNVSGSTDMSNIVASSNVLFDNERGAIEIEHAGATATMSYIAFTDNICTQADNDFDGVTYNTYSSAPAINCLKIQGNTFIGVSSTTEYGITSNISSFISADISGNTFKNWARGIWFASAAIADKEVGKNVIVDGNIFDTISTYGIGMNISTGKYGLHFNSTFINCAAETSDSSRVIAATRKGGGTFDIRKNAAPTDGVWIRGDIVTNSSPSSGAAPGWVCVFSLQTTLSATEPSGETSMAVTSGTGTSNGDIIGVMQDSGTIRWTTISSGGGTTTLVLTSGLTGDAASGNAVYIYRFKAMANLA